MQKNKLHHLSNDFGFVVDAKNNITGLLPSNAKPFGFSANKFMGNAFANLFFVENKKYFAAQFKKAVTNKSVLFECELPTKNSDTIWYKISIAFNKKDKTFFVYFSDVNELKKQLLKSEETVQQLKQSNTFNHQIIHSTQAIILRLDTKNKIVSISKGAEKILGYSNTELVNKNWFSTIVPPQKFPNFKADFEKFIRSNSLTRIVTAPIVCKNGTQKLISWKTSKIFVDNILIGTVGIGKDVTEITQKVQLLQESEKKFRDLAALVPTPISFIATNGDIVFLNKAYTKVFGYTLAEIPNVETLIDVSYKNEQERKKALSSWKMDLLQLKRGRSIQFIRQLVYNKKGEKRIIEYSATMSQNFIYYAYIDITLQIEKEKLLVETKEVFRRIAENTPVAIAGCDVTNFKVIFANNNFVELLGYTVEDINKMDDWGDIIMYVDEEEKEKSVQVWQNVKQELYANSGSTIKSLERKIQCKNGEVKHIEVAVTYDNNTIYALFYDITERKIAENKLKQSEARFRNLAELMSFPVSFVTIDGQFIFLNKAFTDKFGYTLNDFANIKTVVNNTQSDKKTKKIGIENWQNEVKGLFETKKTITNNIDIETKAGEIRQVEYSASLSDGFVFYIYSDITEQKEAENKLRESEERFRNLAENLPVPVISLHAEKGLVFANQKQKELIGHSNDTVKKATNFTKYIVTNKKQPDAKSVFLNSLKTLRENKETHLVLLPPKEMEILCLDGVKRTFEISETIFGKTLYAIFHDITEQRKANELLKENEQRFKALAENMPISIGAYDLKGKVIFVNNYFTHLTGYFIDDVPTIKDWYKLTQPSITRRMEFYNYWTKTVADFRAGKLKHKPEIKASSRCKDGSFKYFTYSFSIHNDITYILILDITEEERAKKELEKSHQELRNLASHLQNIREEERKYVAREIHDELGQQLTGIKMDVSAIFKKVKAVDNTQETAFKQVLDMLNLSVKTVRKISSQLRPSMLDDLGLPAAIEWQAHEFTKRTGVVCVFNNKLNNEIFTPEIQSNLFRILQESLTNIMRHAFAKNVIIDLQNINNSVCLTVSDDGKGFNQKLSKPTLGLLGMKERALMIKGNFKIETVKGKGSVVRISVPI